MTCILIEKAKLISRIAHRGQTRSVGEPYFEHPCRVANAAVVLGCPDHVVAASYLHDVIEDCEINAEELTRLLSDAPLTVPTVDLVLEVTNVAKPSDGNRAVRMGINRDHLAKSSLWGATLKCFDITDNLSSDFYDAQWARIYFAEKELELPVLKHAHPTAWDRAYAVLQSGPTVVPVKVSID